jgi:hypothetical protein
MEEGKNHSEVVKAMLDAGAKNEAVAPTAANSTSEGTQTQEGDTNQLPVLSPRLPDNKVYTCGELFDAAQRCLCKLFRWFCLNSLHIHKIPGFDVLYLRYDDLDSLALPFLLGSGESVW